MKAWLSRNEVPFDVRLVTVDTHREELMQRALRTVPVTVVGDRELQGYDPAALSDAIREGGFSPVVRNNDRLEAKSLFAPLAPLSDALVCSGFLDGTVTLIDRRHGRYLGATLEASSIRIADNGLLAVESCPQAGSFACMNHETGTVTFISISDGRFLRGDLASSTRLSGKLPMHALSHPEANLLYVSNSESRDLTVFDPSTGDYAFGSFERSRFALHGMPGVMALDPERNLLYVRQREGNVSVLDARSLRPAHGSLENSTFHVGPGRSLALSPDGRVLYVPVVPMAGLQPSGDPGARADGLALFDALGMQPLHGTLPLSRVDTAALPIGIAVHPLEPIVYVACVGAQLVELRDSRTGAYLNGSAELSSIAVGGGARAMVVDPEENVLYVASFDASLVMMFDALSGQDRFGNRSSSSLKVAHGPRDLRLIGSRRPQPA